MSSFKLAFHNITGRRIVEVWEGRDFIAAIYPDDAQPRAFRVITKYPTAIMKDDKAIPHAINIIVGRHE